MSVFYRGRRALITHEALETLSVTHRRYAISDLADVHIVRIDPEPNMASRVMGLSALGAAVFVVPVVGTVSHLLTVFAVAVLLVSAGLTLRQRPAVRWDLVAWYRGNPTTLFTSGDQSEFDQVCRGLKRSMEWQ